MLTDQQCRRWVWGLVIFGFALRLALGVALGLKQDTESDSDLKVPQPPLLTRITSALNKPPEPGSDPEEYDTYAWNVARGRGYRGMSPDVSDQDHLTAYRPPGTSLTWAAVYAVVGHRYDTIRLLHCVFGAASIATVYSLGRRCFNPTVGLLAAIGYTVFPHAILYSVELLSEAQATFLFLLYLIACLDFAEQPGWGRATWAGVLLGLAMICRPAYMFMIPLTFLWALWQFRDRRKAILQSLAIPVAVGACMAPWVVRNYLVFHEFIPFSTMGGSVLLQGNNRVVYEDPDLQGYSVWDTKIPEYADALRAPNDEIGRDRKAGELAKAWIKGNLDKLPFMAQAKLRRAFTPFLQGRSPWHFRWGMLLSWGPVLVLFLISFVPTLVTMLRDGRPGWLIHLGILHYVMTSLIFFGYARYRHPVEPLCMILAAVTVDFVLERIWSRPSAALSKKTLLPASSQELD